MAFLCGWRLSWIMVALKSWRCWFSSGFSLNRFCIITLPPIGATIWIKLLGIAIVASSRSSMEIDSSSYEKRTNNRFQAHVWIFYWQFLAILNPWKKSNWRCWCHKIDMPKFNITSVYISIYISFSKLIVDMIGGAYMTTSWTQKSSLW